MKLNDEMSRHWFKLPLKLRKRWWEETDYGKKEASEELKQAVHDAMHPPLKGNDDSAQ